MKNNSTRQQSYTSRLLDKQYKKWKTTLDVQRPYRWNIRRLKPGKTLDLGCGIGRILKDLPAGSVGIDHNKHSIKYLVDQGLVGFTPSEFKKSSHNKPESFDSILLSHVLEHMTLEEGAKLTQNYLPLLKKSGKLILICPQESGYSSDATHVTFLDVADLENILKQLKCTPVKSYSFPFPRSVGKIFTYNETVVIGQK